MTFYAVVDYKNEKINERVKMILKKYLVLIFSNSLLTFKSLY